MSVNRVIRLWKKFNSDQKVRSTSIFLLLYVVFEEDLRRVYWGVSQWFLPKIFTFSTIWQSKNERKEVSFFTFVMRYVNIYNYLINEWQFIRNICTTLSHVHYMLFQFPLSWTFYVRLHNIVPIWYINLCLVKL